MIAYLPINFPSNYAIDTLGPRFGIITGVVLTLIGMWVKCLINAEFYMIIVGQIIAAIGQPFLMNAPAKVSAYWFSDNGRAIATTVASIANPIGVAIGFVLPTFFVDDDDKLPINKELAREHIFTSLLVQAILGTVLSIFVILLFRSRPPTKPSPSAQVTRDNFRKAFRNIIRNKNFILLFIGFATILGAFNTLGTVIEQVTSQYDFTSDDAGMFGAVFIVGGLIGSIIAGVYVDSTKRFKVTIMIIGVTSLGSMASFIFTLPERDVLLTTIVCGLIGLTMVPILPIGFEFACEVTFPIGEAMSGGILMTSGQIVGIIFILLISMFLDEENYTEQ